MLDGDDYSCWLSGSRRGGGWVEIDSPESQFFQSIIVTSASVTDASLGVCRNNLGCAHLSKAYYNVCLFVNDESVPEVCTEDEYGNPLLSGDEITFTIKPRYVNKEFT